MPRTSKLSILAGGSVLCVAAVTSVTAITCPATASAATVLRTSASRQASVPQQPSTAPAASLLSGSLLAESLPGSVSAASASEASVPAAASAAQWAASYRTLEAAGRMAATTAAAAWGRAYVLADIRVSAVNAAEARLALRARQASARAAAAHAAAVRAAVARAEAVRAAVARAEAARAEAARRAAAQAAARRAARRAAARRAASSYPSPSSGQWQPRSFGSPQRIAQHMLDADGQGGQFSCLDSLWRQESGWNVYAQNPGSGAYGIPQALPGRKMASAGPDWRSNPATQIAWGLSYIESTYRSPCAAWAHEQATGWY
jgi:hypothetical protein